jgi:hypothetical protein
VEFDAGGVPVLYAPPPSVAVDGVEQVEALRPGGGQLGALLVGDGRCASRDVQRRRHAAGLAAVGIGMGIPGYQTPAETPDRVESDTLITAARLAVATVWLLGKR